MAYITPSDIKYYRVNAVNANIAQGPLGTGNPTEEIAAPFQSEGTYSSIASLTITGSTTTFESFDVGQYLYFIDGSGNYQLVGQIATIASNLSLTISATPVNVPTVGSILAAAYALITNNESIYVRIPTTSDGAGSNQLFMPNFGIGGWRLGSGLANPDTAVLQQISVAGTPLVEIDPIRNINFTFITTNIFTPSGQTPQGVTTYFANSAQFPSFIWIKVTPSIGASTTLASQTLYRFNINESQPSITIYLGYPQNLLTAAGYNVTGGTSAESGQGTGN